MINNEPKIYTTPENQIKQKRWYQTWRIIYPILGVVVLVELIFGLKTLLAPLPKSKTQISKPLSSAEIILVSAKKDIKVGDDVPIRARVSTGGYYTSGTDLILRFDPKVLEASQSAFTAGKMYQDYPLISIDGKNGVIRISGITTIGKKDFSILGEFGAINFKAKSAGATSVTIDFKKGQTNDSNVIRASNSEDILGKVSNITLTIK